MAVPRRKLALLVAAVLAGVVASAAGMSFSAECNITWNPENFDISGDGGSLSMALVSNTSGAAMRTFKQFLFGSVSVDIQLAPGNSAGTVTTYYTSSSGSKHDEIDFEFLGNETGEPYTIHTNIFTSGEGEKEMQFKPWFDPTTDYHTYQIFWNPSIILWLINDIPIRSFKNHRKHGIPFPTGQPQWAYSSIWNADDWATQGGRIKADWSNAPFIARYRNLRLDVCECYESDLSCVSKCTARHRLAATYQLSEPLLGQLMWIQQNYLLYDYCKDEKRFADGAPPECAHPQY